MAKSALFTCPRREGQDYADGEEYAAFAIPPSRGMMPAREQAATVGPA